MISACVDSHDPPVRTMADLEREDQEKRQRLLELWSANTSTLTRTGRHRIPTADSLNRVLLACGGDKLRAAKMLGVATTTIRKWIDWRGLRGEWVDRVKRPVYSSKGERWEDAIEARKALRVSKDVVYTTIKRGTVMRRHGHRMLSYEPFPGVKYEAAS